MNIEAFIPKDGEMGALMRSIDWSSTPLGAMETWSQSLRTSVSICLQSRFPILIWWGRELVMLYNDAYRPILGMRKHPQAMGQRGKDCWTEIWHVIGPMLESVLDEGEATWSDDQLLLLDRNGYLEECYFTFSYSPILDETGGVGGIFTAVTETTERVLSERRLSTLRELAAKTAETVTVEAACAAIATVLTQNPDDVPFALLYQLDSATQQATLTATTGLTADTSLSLLQIDCAETEIETDLSRCFSLVLQTGQPQLLSELSNWIDWSTQSIPCTPENAVVLPVAQSGQEQWAGFLVLGVSARRALDEKYQNFFELVAAQVATAIANARAYEEERKRAEALAELDHAKTLFFSNVSHEFRTPLTLMLAPTEDLLEMLSQQADPTSAQQRESVELIHRNGLRLLKLVNTLLDFSRIEAGRVQAVYEATDLSQYTADLASVFRSLIERAGLQLVVDCPPLSEPIYVDREMWEKIVLNLLSNAFKFTFAGTITVRLQQQGNQVQLSVEDTGIGIPQSELPHLFERFHRVKNAQGRSFEGSGIGLSLVQELVKLHGGTVDVRSREGYGSFFQVTLPIGVAHLPPDLIAATHSLTSTATGALAYVEEAQRWLPESVSRDWEPNATDEVFASLTERSKPEQQPKRILLADDNADMREYVKRLLTSHYQVETIVNGREALIAAQQHPPDLVLTDVMMPDMDGLELLRSLRAHPHTQAISIILLSARAGEEARVEGLAAGADDYLIKPFSARELMARVEATLKLAHLRQEALRREQQLRTKSETAQQQAETALKRLDRLLESMAEAFIALDHDWRIIYQNATSERINNKPRSEVLGKTLWEEWPAAVGSISEQQYRYAIKHQVPVQFEQHYYEPPDHDVWLEVRAYPFEEGLGVFYWDISDRKRAEAIIQQSEAQFRQLANAMPQQVWITDDKGKTQYVNQRWIDETGLTLAQSQDINAISHVIHPEDLEPTTNLWQASLATGTSYESEFRLKHCKRETYRWFLSRAIPIRDEHGQIGQWFGTSTDIDDFKRTEKALRQSESRFRLIVESAKDYAIFTLDLDGRITSWNVGAERLLGYTEAEIIGKHSRIIFVPEDIAQGQAEREMHIALTTGRAENERWHIRKDGSRFWASGLVMPLLNEADEVQGLVKIMQDKTAQRQADQRLQLLYEMTSELLAADQPLTLMDNLFNKLSQQLALDFYYNFVVDEKDSRPVLHLRNYAGLTPVQAQAVEWVEFGQALCGQCAQLQQPIVLSQAELIIHPTAQSLCTQGVTAYAGYPLIAQGHLLGTLSFASRTRTQFTPEELDLLQAVCEQVAIALERSNLLTSIQHQAEQLQQANRVKDEFLAVLSHELRSPLNPILGWTKLLRSREFDAHRAKEALATIERNAKLQAQLIEDLLDVSRIISGKLILNSDPVNLPFVVTSALETVRLGAEAKQIQLATMIPPEDVLILGDATRLQQVMWNLLSNAVKFTPQGGRIAVTLTKEGSDRGAVAKLTVSDTGKGIAPEFLPYLFDYFRQEDASTTRRFGGLGLGLAIVRQIVELHGGTVQAESQGEGQGATFTVRLPLQQRDPEAISTGSQFPSSRRSPTASLPLANVRVLVVDDDSDTLEFYTAALESSGATVMQASSATEAMQRLSQAIPDVLLSDIGMPETNGYTLMQQVKGLEEEQKRKIPAIALTAYASEDDQRKALQSGFQLHLAKPIDPDRLIQAISLLFAKA